MTIGESTVTIKLISSTLKTKETAMEDSHATRQTEYLVVLPEFFSEDTFVVSCARGDDLKATPKIKMGVGQLS